MIIRKALIIFLILLHGIANQYVSGQTLTNETIKLGRTLNIIDDYYVDSTNISKITEKVIVEC